MKERRTLQQIYYDILTSIMKENDNETEKLRLTNIQLSSKLAYDKCVEHIKLMKKYKLIEENLCITNKGYNFYEIFTRIILQVNQIHALFGSHVQVPTPEETKVTLEALIHIEQITKVLRNQVNLSKEWLKFQKEMK